MEDRASGHIIFGSKRGQPSEKRVTERVIPGARMKCKKIKQGPRRSASQDGAKFPSQWGSPMKILLLRGDTLSVTAWKHVDSGLKLCRRAQFDGEAEFF